MKIGANNEGFFYVVATPIGNLEDITFRAIRILKEADLILCEDTRVTKRLLDRYEITKPTLSYHARSGLSKVEEILRQIGEGRILALVSDAGTPAISDPGSELVGRIRKEYPEIKIVPIPGPSALTAAISIAGLDISGFVFLGFLPHKKGREKIFKEISESERTIIFYESPHRIMKTLEALDKHCPDRRVVVCRELTKIFEETKVASAKKFFEYFSANPGKIRGEFVVVVESKTKAPSSFIRMRGF